MSSQKAVAFSTSSIMSALKAFFNSDEIEEDDVELPEDLREALKEVDAKAAIVATPIQTLNNKSSKKGGFTKKINPNTEKAMRKLHEQVKESQGEGREIGE